MFSSVKHPAYFAAGFAYKDHGGSGLTRDQRIAWREARRQAMRELRVMGFKEELNARTREEAQRYADEWNAKYKADARLGPLQVYEYTFL